MILTEEEKELLREIEDDLLCIVCKKLVTECVALKCPHCACRKCFDLLHGYCPECSEVIRKVSNDAVVSQLVQNIADSYKKFTQVVGLSPKEVLRKQSIDSFADSQISCPPISVISTSKVDSLCIDTANNRIEIDDGKEFSFVTSSSDQSQIPFSSYITPSQDMVPNDTFRTFSSTCADCIHDIQSTKDAIERLIATNGPGDIQLSQSSCGNSSNRINKDERTSSSHSKTFLSLPVIIEYAHVMSMRIVEECVKRDWICVLNDRKLSLSDPIKLFVTDSIPSADGSTKTVPYLKALLLGCQVVHMRWLEDSVKKSILLNPSGYHIEEQSNKFQQRNQEGKLSLFEDFEFIIKEGSKRRIHELINREDIAWMIEIGGGRLYNEKIKDLNPLRHHTRIVLHLQLKSRNPPIMLDKDELREENVSISWLFDAIYNMKIPNQFDPYRI